MSTKPVVLDLDDPIHDGQTLPDALAGYGHVHSTTGICVKNDRGPLCPPMTTPSPSERAHGGEAGRLSELCPCGCPLDAHVGEIGCACGLPDEPPCSPVRDRLAAAERPPSLAVQLCEHVHPDVLAQQVIGACSRCKRYALAVLESDWLADRESRRPADEDGLRAEGWDEAVQAVAWAMDNGPEQDALRYVAEHNPYRSAEPKEPRND